MICEEGAALPLLVASEVSSIDAQVQTGQSGRLTCYPAYQIRPPHHQIPYRRTFLFFLHIPRWPSISASSSQPKLYKMSARPARTGQKTERKHVALEDDILATGQVKQKAPKRKQRHENEFGDEKYVDSKSSAKVLKISREMVDEEEEEANKAKGENVRNTAFEFEGVRDEDGSEEEEEGKFEDDTWGDDEEIVEEVEMSPEDLATWRKFNPTMEDDLLTTGGAWGDGQAQEGSGMGGMGGMGESTNLADLILEKIAEAEAKKEGQFMTGAVEEEAFELPPKVVEVYTK